MHVRQRAETLLTNNHYDPESVREIADGVTSRWQQLVTRAEERHKLVTASLNFYKTAEQVSPFKGLTANQLLLVKRLMWLTYFNHI